MYAQLNYFDGPRSPELVAASDFGGRERIWPAILADPVTREGHVATYVLRQDDGGEIAVVIVKSLAALERGREVIMNTELLPSEDPALLPGPDRMEVFEVVASMVAQEVTS
jgi:hypothetical protein